MEQEKEVWCSRCRQFHCAVADTTERDAQLVSHFIEDKIIDDVMVSRKDREALDKAVKENVEKSQKVLDQIYLVHRHEDEEES